jgi:hypothetical protein
MGWLLPTTPRDLSKISGYHLVHAIVAHAKGPQNSPVMSGFVSKVDEINSPARRAVGFVRKPCRSR